MKQVLKKRRKETPKEFIKKSATAFTDTANNLDLDYGASSFADGGEIPDDLEKLNTYQKRISANMQSMSTELTDWRSVAIIGKQETENHKGFMVEMPLFDFPKGYKPAPSIFKMSHGQEPMNCELCGKVGIKNLFYIQNDKKEWLMSVGSECVTHFGEGKSGKEKLREAKLQLAEMMDTDLKNLKTIIKANFSHVAHIGYGKQERKWDNSYVDVKNSQEGEYWDNFKAYFSTVDPALVFDKKDFYKENIKWHFVYNSIPVYGVLHAYSLISSATGKNPYGETKEVLEKNILTWFKRNEETGKKILEQLPKLIEITVGKQIDFKSEYLESFNHGETEMKFNDGGPVVDERKAQLLKRAAEILEESPSWWAAFFLKNVEGGLQFIAEQMNSSDSERAGAIKMINEDFAKIAIEMFPDAKPSNTEKILARGGKLNTDFELTQEFVAKFNHSKRKRERVKDAMSDYDNDITEVNFAVAAEFFYAIAKKLNRYPTEIDFQNASKKPANHFQISMYLGDVILWAIFVYVDDSHNVILEQSTVELLNGDYETVKVLHRPVSVLDKYAEGGPVKSLPAVYSMTETEYQEKALPLLKAFDKFKKNYVGEAGYFKYFGSKLFSYPEIKKVMQERGKLDNSGYNDFANPNYGSSPEEYFELRFGRKSSGPNLIQDVNSQLIHDKDQFVKKLTNLYGNEIVENTYSFTAANFKTLASVIKYSISSPVFQTYLHDGIISIEQIEKLAADNGIKVPNSFYSKEQLAIKKKQGETSKALSKIDPNNAAKLQQLFNEILIGIKPLEDEIFIKTKAHYKKMIDDILSKQEIRLSAITSSMPFYHHIFTIQEEKSLSEPVTKYDRHQQPHIVHQPYILLKGFSLKQDWEARMDKEINDYIEMLRGNLIASLTNNFSGITKSICKIETVNISKGVKGFQGLFSFEFNDGSSFLFETKGIPAGGYNIQEFHYRYISDFVKAFTADGQTYMNPSLSKINELFADTIKAVERDPYKRVQQEETAEEIRDIVYDKLKNNWKYDRVRKSQSKNDFGISFKLSLRIPSSERMRYKYRMGVYFKIDDINAAKAAAEAILVESGVEREMANGGEIENTYQRVRTGEINADDPTNPDIKLVRGGSIKEVNRDGYKIKFVSNNPYQTYKGLLNWLEKNKIQYSGNQAVRTNSKYVDFNYNNLSISVRVSDHTKKYLYDDPNDESFKIDFNGNLEIDTSSGELNLKEIIDIIEITNSYFNKYDFDDISKKMQKWLLDDFEEFDKNKKNADFIIAKMGLEKLSNDKYLILDKIILSESSFMQYQPEYRKLYDLKKSQEVKKDYLSISEFTASNGVIIKTNNRKESFQWKFIYDHIEGTTGKGNAKRKRNKLIDDAKNELTEKINSHDIMSEGGTIKKATSLAQVNKALHKKYPKIDLVRGNDYYYLHSNDKETALKLAGLRQTGIYVYSIKQMTIDQWIKEVEYLLHGEDFTT